MAAILKITLKLDLTRNFAMALYQIFTTTIRSTISENLVLLTESEHFGPKSAHICPTNTFIKTNMATPSED
jgi:hypothetical protein